MRRFRVTAILDRNDRSISVVEQLDSVVRHHESGVFVSVSMRPLAVLVREARIVSAFDDEGHAIELDRLCEDNPGLGPALEQASS